MKLKLTGPTTDLPQCRNIEGLIDWLRHFGSFRDNNQIDTVYEKRWSSEELHRSLKQNTGLEKMPAKKEYSQANHIFASMLAQVKLEALKMSTKQHHYALKRNILIQSLKKAWKEIQKLKELCLEKNIKIPNFLTA